ncbi:site-specific integrase [Aliarcobacter butzleri]|uniref:Site-specific integrase n=1 Tax=Aliarcobacter butzleri TaxID=28197 RepID=A0AAW7Q0I2_9BACT|nr:site-specific integrase [Aliarcobacter butzleri]MDN5071411.1 site-specific integrase [Aliarcobacter butzleri]
MEKKLNNKRVKTNLTGVYYRQVITNNKVDKVFYITYKNQQNKMVELKIGKYSEGIREAYCNQKRNEILTKQRNGEEPPLIISRKKKEILYIDTIANSYYNSKPKADRTLKGYYINHILPFFKNYDFENITNEDITKFTNTLKSKIGIRTAEPLAPKTINIILNTLKSIIKYAFTMDLIKNDFSKYIQLLDIDNARERFLTKDEINLLYEKSKNDEIIYLYFKLALNTGGRLATLQNICKKDIDFTHNLLTLKDYKNHTTYKIFLNKALRTLLKERVENMNLNDKVLGSYPQLRIKNILDDLFNQGINTNDRKNRVVFHTLRHTFASHLAINGTPIFTIQKLMNHKDINMTLRYAKLSPDSGKEALENLSL